LLLYPAGLEFITAFFGCLYAGVMATPAYPPRRNQNLSRLQAVVTDAQAPVALTTTSLLANIEGRFAQYPELADLDWLATDNLTSDLASDWQEAAVNSDSLAFLQYTSGSTGKPKGVMVSHGNLLHNQRMIEQAFGHTHKTVVLGWLPLFHDMGLIGNLLQPMYIGQPCILTSPVAFLQKPLRWLQAISDYQATTSGGPNFAYDLCVRKATPEKKANLDLSSWEVAFNGAEPIRAETLDQFAATFESCGFRKSAFYPCYGMAETTLFISGGRKTAPPVISTVDGAALEQNQVVTATPEQSGARKIVGCGQAWLDQEVAIAHPESLTRCPAEVVGEIWVSGASVAQGYWNRPQQTEATFCAYLADTGEGPFLRTGDLGFIQDGELFVTGRLNDVIIIRGRNHYPQDIELTVENSHPALRPGCAAAFAVEIGSVERLVIVAEVERRYRERRRNSGGYSGVERRHNSGRRQSEVLPSYEPQLSQPLDFQEVVGNIREAVAEHHGLQTYAAVLVKTGSISKTSSGKIQRHAVRAGFRNGSLDALTSQESVK
jgi:acyl-CoA synthetase (AMP-forming)/AMP-acid ligase II